MLRRCVISIAAIFPALTAAGLPAQAAAPTIALILDVKGSPFDDALACGALAKAKALGLTLSLFAPDHFTDDAQAPVIDAVTARAPEVAVMSPADSQAVTRPMRHMADRSTKLITVDITISDPSFVASQVVTSNLESGRMAADAMIAVLIAQDPKREGELSVELAKQILDGKPVAKQAQADTVVIKANETDKADRFEYKSDCTLSY